MMIFPRLAERRWTTKNVSRFTTYVSFQTSLPFFFCQSSKIETSQFPLYPILSHRRPPAIFSKNIGPHDLLTICIPRRLSRRASLFKIPLPLRPPTGSHAFQQLHFSVGSCSPRIQSYRRLVRAIISPFMILSQGSCIYVHASQFNGKHMLDRGRISEMCAIFFASCFTFALLFTVSRRDYERCYLNPFHSPWFQDIQHSSTYVARVKKLFTCYSRNVKPHRSQIWIFVHVGKNLKFFFFLPYVSRLRKKKKKKTYTLFIEMSSTMVFDGNDSSIRA